MTPFANSAFGTARNAFFASLLLLGMLAIPAASRAQEYEGGTMHFIENFPIDMARTVTHNRTTVAPDYSNITNFQGAGFANGGSAVVGGFRITRLVADDLTPTGINGGNDIVELTFSVANFNAVPVTARARIRFWNDNANAPGTYYSNPAPIGFTFNPITFPPGVSLYFTTFTPNQFKMPSTTFWAGMTFDEVNAAGTGTTGITAAQLDLLGQGLFDPVDVGSSDDQAFRTNAAGSFFTVANPAGTLFNFGGDPVTNFGWEFLVDEPVPATKSTWGRIKSVYR